MPIFKLQKKLLTSSLIHLRKSIPCIICGKSIFKSYWQCDGFSFLQCRNCSLVFQNPQPTQDEVSSIYNHDYFQYQIHHQNAFFQLMQLALDDIHFDQIQESFPNQRRFLDIGCSTGLLLNKISQDGWEPFGVELCTPSYLYAKKYFKLNLFNQTLEQCAFPSSFFQVIHFSHLIEHLINPSFFISEVYRILQPQGYIILTTPNISSIFAQIFREKWRSAIDQHLFLFSKKTLRLLLEKHQFKIIQEVSWGSIPIEYCQSPSSRFLKKIVDYMAKLFNLGDVVMILAQK